MANSLHHRVFWTYPHTPTGLLPQAIHLAQCRAPFTGTNVVAHTHHLTLHQA